MSVDKFIAEFKAYFTSLELSQYDEKRLRSMVDGLMAEPVVVEKVKIRYVEREKIVYKNATKYVYIDFNGNKFDNLIDHPNYNKFIDDVISNACKIWGLEKSDVLGRSRKEQFVNCRRFIALKLRMHGMGPTQIRKILTNYSDHSSILNLFRTGQNFLDAGQEPFCSLWKIYLDADSVSDYYELEEAKTA